MKKLDSFDGHKSGRDFGLELTCLLRLWNHPKTVALYFASGASIPNHATDRRNFCGCAPVRQ